MTQPELIAILNKYQKPPHNVKPKTPHTPQIIKPTKNKKRKYQTTSQVTEHQHNKFTRNNHLLDLHNA